MKMHEYAPSSSSEAPTALLIHPMLSSAEGMRLVVADRMGNNLHYLIPDLSSHGEATSTEYRSAAMEANQIRDWLIGHGQTHLSLGFGASLGGIVLLELLKYPDLTFDRLFFEGTSMFVGARAKEAVVRRMFLSKHRRAAANPQLAIRKMGELYGPQAARPMAESLIAMSEPSIRNIVHDCGNVEPPALSPDVQRRCTFAYGERDFDLSRARKAIPRLYPNATLRVWTGFGHCERIMGDPDAYAAMLRKGLPAQQTTQDQAG